MAGAAGIAITLGWLASLLAALAMARRAGVDAEWTRKGLHVGLGTLALAFPWWFDRAWPVAGLAVAGVAILAALRWVPGWRARVGAALLDVPRVSVGDLCFPLAIALTFVGAAGDRVAYVVPVAILTFADAAAALVGRRWGRPGAWLPDKTLAGSAACLAVATTAAWLGLRLAGGLTASDALALACALGAAAAAIEAASPWGLDNLMLPLATLGLLQAARGLPLEPGWLALTSMASLLVAGATAWLAIGRPPRRPAPAFVRREVA